MKELSPSSKPPKLGVVSGYFNPLHSGHLDYINAARKKCEYLVVIVNNDKQVELKGSKKFMDEEERRRIMSNLKAVTEAFVSIDKDKHVCESLLALSKKYENCELTFYNSGDRNHTASPEKEICKTHNMKTEYLPLPKINSSSALLLNL
jgi:cytidyltransferase-like protein|tara:strand:- start:34 stop:480 length:447 start_codon:yes stop_codon:yes gene_type:complete